ncbi:MAG: 2-amino-4-hydroxy-6-hydroxymethyldihydropteridine diphosphokinase [Thermoleophilaceae bacterium]
MRAHLGLGSNVGDRLAALKQARVALARHGVRVARASSVYETAPQGERPDQADFLNACLVVDFDLGPEELLDVCKTVERELGRAPAGERHAPRPIDIDLLLAGALEYRSERLALPHPEVTARRFVLEPLLELDPGLRLPDGSPLAGRLAAVSGQRVERVGGLDAG